MPGKCGGCAYRHLTYPEELWAKRQRVQDALTRIGGLDLQVEEILGAKTRSTTATRASTPWGLTVPSVFSGPDPQGCAHPPLPDPDGGRRPHRPSGGGVDAPLSDLRLR